jgi:hypothetical protein
MDVFCNGCKYLKKLEFFLYGPNYECRFEKVQGKWGKKNALNDGVYFVSWADPYKKNKNNDCQDFEQKVGLFKRIFG